MSKMKKEDNVREKKRKEKKIKEKKIKVKAPGDTKAKIKNTREKGKSQKSHFTVVLPCGLSWHSFYR